MSNVPTITVVRDEKCPACQKPGLVTAESASGSALRTTCALCGWAHLSSHAGQHSAVFVSVAQEDATAWVQTETVLRATFAHILGVCHAVSLCHLGGLAENVVDALRAKILCLESDVGTLRHEMARVLAVALANNAVPAPAPEEWIHVNTFEDGFQLQMHDWCGWCAYHRIGLRATATDTSDKDGKFLRVTYIFMTKANAELLSRMQTSCPERFGAPWDARTWDVGYAPVGNAH